MSCINQLYYLIVQDVAINRYSLTDLFLINDITDYIISKIKLDDDLYLYDCIQSYVMTNHFNEIDKDEFYKEGSEYLLDLFFDIYISPILSDLDNEFL